MQGETEIDWAINWKFATRLSLVIQKMACSYTFQSESHPAVMASGATNGATINLLSIMEYLLLWNDLKSLESIL